MHYRIIQNLLAFLCVSGIAQGATRSLSDAEHVATHNRPATHSWAEERTRMLEAIRNQGMKSDSLKSAGKEGRYICRCIVDEASKVSKVIAHPKFPYLALISNGKLIILDTKGGTDITIKDTAEDGSLLVKLTAAQEICSLAWNPKKFEKAERFELAVGCEDGSLFIITIQNDIGVVQKVELPAIMGTEFADVDWSHGVLNVLRAGRIFLVNHDDGLGKYIVNGYSRVVPHTPNTLRVMHKIDGETTWSVSATRDLATNTWPLVFSGFSSVEKVSKLPRNEKVEKISLNTDGSCCAIFTVESSKSGKTGRVYIYDVSRGKQSQIVTFAVADVEGMIFEWSSDGLHLAALYKDRDEDAFKLQVIDRLNKKEIVNTEIFPLWLLPKKWQIQWMGNSILVCAQTGSDQKVVAKIIDELVVYSLEQRQILSSFFDIYNTRDGASQIFNTKDEWDRKLKALPDGLYKNYAIELCEKCQPTPVAEGASAAHEEPVGETPVPAVRAEPLSEGAQSVGSDGPSAEAMAAEDAAPAVIVEPDKLIEQDKKDLEATKDMPSTSKPILKSNTWWRFARWSLAIGLPVCVLLCVWQWKLKFAR